MKDFKEAFEEFVSERVGEINDDIKNNNGEFKQVNNDILKHLKEIKAMLPEGLKTKILELESEIYCSQALVGEFTYKRFLKDSVRFIQNLLSR